MTSQGKSATNQTSYHDATVPNKTAKHNATVTNKTANHDATAINETTIWCKLQTMMQLSQVKLQIIMQL